MTLEAGSIKVEDSTDKTIERAKKCPSLMRDMEAIKKTIGVRQAVSN